MPLHLLPGRPAGRLHIPVCIVTRSTTTSVCHGHDNSPSTEKIDLDLGLEASERVTHHNRHHHQRHYHYHHLLY